MNHILTSAASRLGARVGRISHANGARLRESELASISARQARNGARPNEATHLFSTSNELSKKSSHRFILNGMDNGSSSDVTITKTKSATESETHASNNSYDMIEASRLVGELMEYTRSLMTEGVDRNENVHHVIAFSGGIDSSLVAALVYKAATESTITNHPVTAVLGLSPAVPEDQIQLARHVANDVIGVQLEEIPTTEGTDETYIANDGKACLACKTHLYTCLSAIADHYGEASPKTTIRMYNGTNADDRRDPTRLGLIAARNFKVQSPLARMTKAQVRLAARHLGLPNWNYAASPCLRSRLAVGVAAVPEHLRRIERAEGVVRKTLSLDPSQDMRVRQLSRNRGMVEIPAEVMKRISVADTLRQWHATFVDELGFASVDVRAFRSGSVAPAVDSAAIMTAQAEAGNRIAA